MSRDFCTSFPTALGVCTIMWSDRGVTRLLLPDPDRAAGAAANGVTATPPSETMRCIAGLQSYFSGAAVDFSDIALDFERVDPGTVPVYQALRRIGWGQFTTYGQLATAAGKPGMARAIGVAMARNPWPVIVPCHRVLAAGARLGGFSAPGGARTKERLLMLERVQAGDIQPTLPGLF